MFDQLNKIFELIKRTGDRLVVLDQSSGEAFVVMDLGNYEKMIFRSSSIQDLTEEELMNKINRDIAVWRTANPEPEMSRTDDSDDEESGSEDEEFYYLEPTA